MKGLPRAWAIAFLLVMLWAVWVALWPKAQ
jgi:hypothetical protein